MVESTPVCGAVTTCYAVGHVLFCPRLFREIPLQHEFGCEHSPLAQTGQLEDPGWNAKSHAGAAALRFQSCASLI